MDAGKFDQLARFLGRRLDRRGAVAGLLALLSVGDLEAADRGELNSHLRGDRRARGDRRGFRDDDTRQPEPQKKKKKKGTGCPSGQKSCGGTCVSASTCCPQCAGGQQCVNGACTGEPAFDSDGAGQALASVGNNLADAIDACLTSCEDPSGDSCIGCIRGAVSEHREEFAAVIQAGLLSSSAGSQDARSRPRFTTCRYDNLQIALANAYLAIGNTGVSVAGCMGLGRIPGALCALANLGLQGGQGLLALAQAIRENGCEYGHCVQGDNCCPDSKMTSCRFQCCDVTACESCVEGTCRVCPNGGCCEDSVPGGQGPYRIYTCTQTPPDTCPCGSTQTEPCENAGGDGLVRCTGCSHIGPNHVCQGSGRNGTCVPNCPVGARAVGDECCVPDCDGKCAGWDGCGGYCPNTCTGNQVCTGGTCCTPRTCSSPTSECGGLSDLCGGWLNCGQCPGNGICVSNSCCTPPTCDASQPCHSEYACGQMLSCGTCPGEQTCSYGTCVCPSTTAWVCNDYRDNSTNCCDEFGCFECTPGTAKCGCCPESNKYTAPDHTGCCPWGFQSTGTRCCNAFLPDNNPANCCTGELVGMPGGGHACRAPG